MKSARLSSQTIKIHYILFMKVYPMPQFSMRISKINNRLILQKALFNHFLKKSREKLLLSSMIGISPSKKLFFSSLKLFYFAISLFFFISSSSTILMTPPLLSPSFFISSSSILLTPPLLPSSFFFSSSSMLLSILFPFFFSGVFLILHRLLRNILRINKRILSSNLTIRVVMKNKILTSFNSILKNSAFAHQSNNRFFSIQSLLNYFLKIRRKPDLVSKII